MSDVLPGANTVGSILYIGAYPIGCLHFRAKHIGLAPLDRIGPRSDGRADGGAKSGKFFWSDGRADGGRRTKREVKTSF